MATIRSNPPQDLNANPPPPARAALGPLVKGGSASRASPHLNARKLIVELLHNLVALAEADASARQIAARRRVVFN